MYTAEQVISFYEELPVSGRAQVKAYIDTTVPGLDSAKVSNTSVTILDEFNGEARNIVSAIKTVRAAKGYGLKESKTLIDNRPCVIPFDTLTEALKFSADIEAAGFSTRMR